MSESLHMEKYEDKKSVIVLQAIDMCFLHIDNVRLKVLQITKENGVGDSFDEKVFYELIDMLDVLVELVSDIYKIRKRHGAAGSVNVKTIQSLEVHLLFVLKALFAAKGRKDFTVLMDLLKHELMENIIQWKLKAVPELKKIKRVIGMESA